MVSIIGIIYFVIASNIIVAGDVYLDRGLETKVPNAANFIIRSPLDTQEYVFRTKDRKFWDGMVKDDQFQEGMNLEFVRKF